MKEKDIIDAYVRIRTIDQTIPDDVLDFMKQASIEKLKKEYMSELSKRIMEFIAKYAKISPNFNKDDDDDDDKYTGPDPYQLVYCAEQLKNGLYPTRCFSEWSSGCYKNISSKDGFDEHQKIVLEVYAIINSKLWP